MPRLKHTVLILRPAAQVFAFWAGAGAWPRWQTGLRSVVQSPPGPLRKGIALQVSGQVAGRDFDGVLEVVQFEPERKVGLKAEGAPVGVDLQVTFQPDPPGTRLTYQADVKAGLLGALAGPLISGPVKAELENSLAALKRLLESQP